ncbi:MAG: MFS transporter [Alphaproteobacteria bacterium]|nr:MFS transporter [Alphaproteobacteria bacterium]
MQSNRVASLALIALCEVAAMAVWFSASAVVPALTAEVALPALNASLFTSAVQAGFVVGTLVSAILGLADRFDARRLFFVSCLVAAAANGLILLLDPASAAVIVMRFVTGACMAGVYPVGMKLVSTWAKGDMGLMIGILAGALTLGSASPHLFNALGGIDWRFTLGMTSVSALVAGLLILFAGIGPNIGTAPPFNPRLALRAWTVKPVRLANFGYLGHMWELYAMWAWVGVFLYASFTLVMTPETAAVSAALATFATIAAGGVGCVVGGLIADRMGRTTLAIGMMAISGTCALFVGFLFGSAPALLVIVCLIWGFSIVADSAQFSASTAELSEPSLIGTMLTVQTSLGFLLTLATIHLVPALVEAVGWRYAFAFLAPGPALGILAMIRLRAHPDAAKLAGGKR